MKISSAFGQYLDPKAWRALLPLCMACQSQNGTLCDSSWSLRYGCKCGTINVHYPTLNVKVRIGYCSSSKGKCKALFDDDMIIFTKHSNLKRTCFHARRSVSRVVVSMTVPWSHRFRKLFDKHEWGEINMIPLLAPGAHLSYSFTPYCKKQLYEFKYTCPESVEFFLDKLNQEEEMEFLKVATPAAIRIQRTVRGWSTRKALFDPNTEFGPRWVRWKVFGEHPAKNSLSTEEPLAKKQKVS